MYVETASVGKYYIMVNSDFRKEWDILKRKQRHSLPFFLHLFEGISLHYSPFVKNKG